LPGNSDTILTDVELIFLFSFWSFLAGLAVVLTCKKAHQHTNKKIIILEA